MINGWQCRVASLLVTLALVVVLALVPVARADRAASRRPKIYLSTCENVVVAPRSFEVVCVAPGGLLGTTFPSTAEHLIYRHYGSGVALATGVIHACLLGPVQDLRLCPEGLLPPSEEAETSGRVLPASFRFFDVVSCTRVDAQFPPGKSVFYVRPHLFYRKLSYRLAGQAWNTRSIMPRNEVDTRVQPTCQKAMLRVR